MKRHLLILGMALLSCIACNKEYVTETPLSPIFSSATAEVSAAEGSYTFESASSLEGMSAVSDQSWCVPSVTDKGVTVTYTQNGDNGSRKAVISVKDGGGNPSVATLALIQDRASIALEDTGNDVVALKASAVPVNVPVDCAVKWTASSSADWLSFSQEGNILVLTPTQNPTGSVRKAKVILSVGSLSKTFSVEQEGAVLTYPETSIALTAVAGTYEYSITSNVEWAVDDTQEEWIKATNEDGVLKVVTTVNEGNSRSCEIRMTAGNISRRIKFTQNNLYNSLIGSWTLSGQAPDNDGVISLRSITVTISKDNEAYGLLTMRGLGSGFLGTSAEDPVSLELDEEKRTVILTTGEEVGVMEFLGFTKDPDGKARVRTVYVSCEDGKTVIPDTTSGKEVTGAISEDLNTISFGSTEGFGLGMWTASTDEWVNAFCSYRFFNITMTRL